MYKFSIYAFSDEADASIDKQIVALKDNGLQGMEIRNVDGTSVSEISLEKAKEVRKKLDDNGLVVWSIGSPIGKIDIDDDFAKHLDLLKHTLEVANILGAKNIRLFSFFMPKDKSPDVYKDAVIERMGKMIELCKEYGVTPCHENEKGIFGDTAERCRLLLETFPDLKAIFDPANFVQCGVDTKKAWEMLKPYVYYMHIKDAKADGLVVPAGEGNGNVKEIAADYLASGGTAFTIEPHLTIFDGLTALEQEGEKSQIGEFTYKDAFEAFAVACDTFKKIMAEV